MKMSSPPSAGAAKPKPFFASNHLMVAVLVMVGELVEKGARRATMSDACATMSVREAF